MSSIDRRPSGRIVRRSGVVAALAVGFVLLGAFALRQPDRQALDEPPEAVLPSAAPAEAVLPSEAAVAGPVASICELLAVAASADPSLQRAALRPAEDVDAVAAMQRELLLAAASLVDSSDDAAVLTELAGVFVAADGAEGPGAWDDSEWADALIARADVAGLERLARLETECANLDQPDAMPDE